jgi:metallophosphoesterase superfamily enzyme
MKIRGAAGHVRRRCFVSDGRRLILPAFGAFTGGLNLLDAAFAPLFEKPPTGYALGRRVTPARYERLVPDRTTR